MAFKVMSWVLPTINDKMLARNSFLFIKLIFVSYNFCIVFKSSGVHICFPPVTTFFLRSLQTSVATFLNGQTRKL